MTNSILEEEYRGQLIRIEQDDDLAMNPIHEDLFGTIVDEHSKYEIGVDSYEERANLRDGDVVLPLYMYDHSGVSISTEPFNCRFDSGKIGYVYATEEKIKEEFNVPEVTTEIKKKALKLMKQEVDVYSKYLAGEVYMFVTNEDCVGGYTDIDNAVAMAKRSIDFMYNRIKESHIDKLKRWIKGKVGLQYRYPLSVG